MTTQSIVTTARSINAADLARHTLQRRAIEAAIWGVPIVSFDAMRQGFFGVGAKYGDIAYLSKPTDWKLQLTTPNSSSLYVYFNFNLKDGPVILDFPAAVGAGLFGSMMDAWQAPLADVGPAGEDQGKEFKPARVTRAILRQAVEEAHASFMEASTTVTPYWPDAKWGMSSYASAGPRTTFTFQTETGLDVDQRGALFFFACAAPRKLGAASLYLCGARDATDSALDGGKSYRLRVPPNVPARQFWAVTVYDVETAAFIRESPKTEVNSYQDPKKNSDASVDIFFGPKAPAGKESNWIYTESGKEWVAFFRFYGPEPAIHDKTWVLNDIEESK